MNAEYYQSCQYHDRSRSLLVQWNVTSIPVEDHLKAIVEDTLWGKLQEIGFIIPRAEWEQKYPEQVEIERQFQEMFASKNRSEEHTSELQSLMRISYAVFCLKKKKQT